MSTDATVSLTNVSQQVCTLPGTFWNANFISYKMDGQDLSAFYSTSMHVNKAQSVKWHQYFEISTNILWVYPSSSPSLETTQCPKILSFYQSSSPPWCANVTPKLYLTPHHTSCPTHTSLSHWLRANSANTLLWSYSLGITRLLFPALSLTGVPVDYGLFKVYAYTNPSEPDDLFLCSITLYLLNPESQPRFQHHHTCQMKPSKYPILWFLIILLQDI